MTDERDHAGEKIAAFQAHDGGCACVPKVLACCVSEGKGTTKHTVPSITLEVGRGIVGDAHAGNWHRQVSLLARESVAGLESELGRDLAPGVFAENVLTSGIDLRNLPVGTMLEVGSAALVVTQIGKTCHTDCEIKHITGRCVMPTDGIFCVVVRGGSIRPGDSIGRVPPEEVGR